MSVAAINSLALLKQTLSSIEHQFSSKIQLRDKPSSRYQPKIQVNGLYSQRSSSCYNVIKKKRMLRQERSKSNRKGTSRQRATIAVEKLDVMKNNKSDANLGHCINHLDSIIELLKKQKNQKEQPQSQQIQQKANIPEVDKNQMTVVKLNNQLKCNKSKQINSQKPKIQKKYRTVSYSQHVAKQQALQSSIQQKQSIILKFTKKRSKQQQSNQIKPLISKIINDTKRESKTLRLKQIRDKYKHLSKSKSTQNYQITNKITVQSINNQSKRYGRRMMRVCSSGNYQINSTSNQYNRSRDITTQCKKNRYMKYDFKDEERDTKTIKQTKQQIFKTQQIVQNKQPNKPSQGIKQRIDNFIIENKENIIQEQSQKSSRCFDLKEINCSKIEHKIANKSLNSFFSEVPSYLESHRKPIGNLDPQKRQTIKPFKQQKESNLLNLLDVDSMEIKKIFKAKEKRKQLEKWKKNFPEGFFQDVKV